MFRDYEGPPLQLTKEKDENMDQQLNLPFKNEERNKLILFQIEEIETHMSADDFQRDFFESLAQQYGEKQSLSEKQMECLNRIYERVTG